MLTLWERLRIACKLSLNSSRNGGRSLLIFTSHISSLRTTSLLGVCMKEEQIAIVGMQLLGAIRSCYRCLLSDDQAMLLTCSLTMSGRMCLRCMSFSFLRC